MPRTPLGLISGNKTPRKELDPYTRGLIVADSQNGVTVAESARTRGVPANTIRNTLLATPLRNKGVSLPRSGRPKLYDNRDERALLWLMRNNPRWTYDKLISESSVKVSKSTIKRVMKKHGIANWRAKRRPALTPEHARKRLIWARQHQNWTPEQWQNIIWSNKCSLERGTGKERV